MNPSKATSLRQWTTWRANGAVRMHSNPSIDRSLRRFAHMKLRQVPGSVELPDSVAPARAGDLVIQVPADGSRGQVLYIDDDWDYGNGQILVCTLAWTMLWTFRVPRDEVVPVGHIDAHPSEWRAASPEARRQIRLDMEAAGERFFEWFHAFDDGRTEVLLSEMAISRIRSAYAADSVVDGLSGDDWNESDVVFDQTIYSVPRDGYRTHVERVGTGKFRFTVTGAGGQGRYDYYAWLQQG